MLNPDDFVIKRRRKKYRFARFANAANCFEFSDWRKQPIDVVELGAGDGLFSVELARQYPNKSFLAIDVKADRLQKGAYIALEQNITNIQFLRARADQLTTIAERGSLAALWLTFPDPFPRRRNAGRRLTHAHFLAVYQDLLRPDGTLYLKHDDSQFFRWSLEQLVAAGWRITDLTFDLHQSEIERTDGLMMTTYEKRWLADGKAIGYLAAQHT